MSAGKKIVKNIKLATRKQYSSEQKNQHVRRSERLAMKSMDHISFAASGTASGSGFSRCSRLRGLIRMFSSSLR